MSKPAPPRINKDTEKKLLGYLDKVAEHIGSGDTPNQAIIKVARSHDVELGHVRLMAQAYNNARTNQQRKSSEDLYEKIANFQLADIKTIANELYPETVKTAAVKHNDDVVSEDYKYLPPDFTPSKAEMSFTKQAYTQPLPSHEKDYHIKKGYSLLRELKTEFENKRRAVSEQHDKVAAAYDELRYFFKLAGNNTKFMQVAANAMAFFGKRADALMRNVAKDIPGLMKKGNFFGEPFRRGEEPYSLIEACLQGSTKYASLKAAFDEFSKEAAATSFRFNETFVNERPAPIYGSIMKTADDNPLGSLGSSLSTAVTEKPLLETLKPVGESVQKGLGKPDNKLQTDAFKAITDPSHEGKLRAMRAQSMLTDMMANDPFLSGESPERVLGLYNQITKLSPRAADQPLLMRALLRRYLAQGQVDPHDVDQLVGIETKIKQRDEPTREYNLPKLPTDFTHLGGGAPKRED